MRMNRMAALVLSAGMITMAACSDAPTAAPSAAALNPKTPSFAAGDPVGTVVDNTPVLGQLIICKAGNVGGSFDLSQRLDPSGTIVPSSIDVATGQCKIAAVDNSGSGVGRWVTVTEEPADNTDQDLTGCSIITEEVNDPGNTTITGCSLDGTLERFINQFHGYVLTYTNDFEEPPPPVCTYTKGWYQNKNGEPTIIDGIDGRSKADQIAIFNASPGQPGSVKWGVNGATDNKPNNLLNLYQQLLAALNNLKGNATGGPDDVDNAISAALGITSGTGTNISITPAGVAQISGLISTLSAFNEGQFKGFPHCGDEVTTSN